MAEAAIDTTLDESNDEQSTTSESSWPETWREMYAGEDEGKLSKVSKYASPVAALDAMIAAQTKISSGDYKKQEPFPVEGTDEQKAEWRTSNGIPESPDKYDLTFDNGLVIGDGDKDMIADFTAFAHERNLSPDSVKAAVEWKYANNEKQLEAMAARDTESKTATEDALRAEWGEEYRANINRIHGLLDTAPGDVKEQFLSARDQNGTPLGNNPEVLKFLIDMALQINPATTLVPGAGDNIAGAISDELAELKTMMGNKNSEYWKGPKADSYQQRYRDLLTAQQKMKK